MTSTHSDRQGISRRAIIQGGLGLGFATAFPSVLSACGSSGPPASTGLTFPFVTDEVQNAAYRKLCKLYAASSGGQEVNLSVVPGNWQALQTRINAQRQTGNPPDLSIMAVSLIPSMTARKQLVDLAPLAKNLDRSKYSAGAMATYEDGAHLWAMPANQHSQVMYYNKTLLDKAGIAEPPASWDTPWSFKEWRASAEAVSTNDGNIYGTCVEIYPERTCQYLWSNGATFLNEDATKYEMNSPEAKDTFSFLAKLFADSLVPPVSLLQKLNGMELFTAGRVGSIVSGTWDMGLVTAVKDFKWGVTPAPAGATGQSYTPLWVDGLIIPAGTKKTEEAWKAIEFFSQREAWDLLVSLNVGGIPPLTSAAKANETKLFPGLSDERKQVWFDSVKHSKVYGVPANYGEVLNTVTQELTLLTTGNKSVSAVLDGLEKPVQALLDQNRGK